jgi:hypothetical protein
VKKINFVPDTAEVLTITKPPKSAKNYIPEWYKKTPKLISKNDKIAGLEQNSQAPNTTIKSCVPFLDALTCGYIWELPSDLEFRKFGDDISIRWRFGHNVVSSHSQEQHPFLPSIEATGKGDVFKFGFNYQIETPKGYSTLFTHPLNRHDLPFRTFSGVVDTDVYQLSVQFPFQIVKPFEEVFILEQGTPVIQFIPIKRDNWTHSVDSFDENKQLRKRYEFFSHIQSVYKKHFWVKKSYN